MSDEGFDSGGDSGGDCSPGSDITGSDPGAAYGCDFNSDTGADLGEDSGSDDIDTGSGTDIGFGDDLNGADSSESMDDVMDTGTGTDDNIIDGMGEDLNGSDCDENIASDDIEQPESELENPEQTEEESDQSDDNDQTGSDGDNVIPSSRPERVSYLMNQDDFGGFKVEGHSNRDDFGNEDSNYNIKTGNHFTTESDGVMLNTAPGGTFVLPSDQMDNLVDRSLNDTENFASEINTERRSRGLPEIDANSNRILEERLGKEPGSLGDEPIMQIYENVTDSTELSPPQGEESTNTGKGVAHGLNEYVIKNPTAFDTNNVSIIPNKK